MAMDDVVVVARGMRIEEDLPTESRGQRPSSAVAWAAVIAGGLAAASTSVVLTVLGAGLGLTTVSPWTNAGVTAGTFGIMAISWMIVIQWLSSALGGYLTGRLRLRWAATHEDEVFFRDTAHGFLAWTVATLIVVAVVSSTVFSAAGGIGKAATSVAAGATQGAAQGAATGAMQKTGPSGLSGDTTSYFTDTLFRSDGTADHTADAATRGEATHILVRDLTDGDISAADRTYLAQLVAAKTGVDQAEAQKRVDDVIAQVKTAEDEAKQAADKARKTSASIAIYTALSMVIGAFIAAAAAGFGGRLRDEHA